jgi:hypothetical protein
MSSPGAIEAEPDDADSTPYGYCDGVLDGEATGWCWRASDPAARLEVEVLVDGQAVARGQADRRRQNVAQAGYGDGRYGFRVPLPETVADGGSHRIAVRVEGAVLPASDTFIEGGVRSGAELEPAPDGWASTTFIPDEALAEARTTGEASTGRRRLLRRGRDAEEPESAELRGYVEGVEGGELFGWIVESSQPEQSLRVQVTVDGAPLGTVDADLSRRDVARAGYGEKHGFRVALPDELAPGHHTIEVRSEDGLFRVPLATDYIVTDAGGAPIEGVILIEATSGAPPPALTSPQEALIGLDGWIFEWWPGDFHILRGVRELPPDSFKRNQVRLRERHELARSAGATLIEAVIPAKLAAYREYLPLGLAVEDSARPADRLAAEIREQNESDVLDLAVALRHARRHGDVFARSSRGLSWLGAFAVYRAIAKELARARPGIEPLRREALRFDGLEALPDSLSDLQRVVWVGSGTVAAATIAEDEDHEGQPRLDWTCLAGEYAVLPPELRAIAGGAAALLRRRTADRGAGALVIHDGSAERVAPFLAEHFDRTLVVGPGADLNLVVAELAPAVIVEIVAEATLLRV